MSPQKLIVVVGATGNQGSSVIETFLSEPEWRIRGITRNTSSAAAQALSAKGAEMVAANLDDVASLHAAFKGATAVFGVTDFWHPFTDPANHAKVKAGQTINQWCYEYELQQAKNIFEAAARVEGLQKLIWSSLSAARRWSKGKYTWVYHFDSKADAAEYARETYPELWEKTSVIQIGFYLSNYHVNAMAQPKQVSGGSYEIMGNASGGTLLPLIATEEDTGPFVRALVSLPAGKNLIAYRAWMGQVEFTEILSRVTGFTVRYREISFGEMMGALPETVAREVAESLAYFDEFGYEGRDDKTLVHPRELGVDVGLPSVEDWVRKQDWSHILKA